MFEEDDDVARRRRADVRRSRWPAGEVIPSGTPKPSLHAGTTAEERVARVWILTRRLWLMSGRALPELSRHEAPGEVFDIRAERGRAPR